jgi:hypothetical protein
MQTWYFVGRDHGISVKEFRFGGNAPVDHRSQVVASICEVGRAPGGELEYPFMGSAAMQVLNVVPEDGGIVRVRFSIDWDHPLDYRMTFFINP